MSTREKRLRFGGLAAPLRSCGLAGSLRFGCLAAALLAGAAAWGQQTPAEPKPDQGPQLGVPATEAQVAGWDVSIPPDGAGLPPGSGTPAQGAAIYAVKCIGCHGVEGAGKPNDQLVGGQDTLASAAPVRTIGSYWPYATTLFDYVRRAMPYPTPHSLTADETYALTAYLLKLNGIVGDDAVMDAKSLPRVQMPNRGNFEPAYPTWKQ
jgi:mono/diheme cytochrome c family protein